MYEYWACVGLACFRKDFFDDVRQQAVEDAAGGREKGKEAGDEAAKKALHDNWLLRLGCGQFRDLRKLVRDGDIAELMNKLKDHKIIRGCKLPSHCI